MVCQVVDLTCMTDAGWIHTFIEYERVKILSNAVEIRKIMISNLSLKAVSWLMSMVHSFSTSLVVEIPVKFVSYGA